MDKICKYAACKKSFTASSSKAVFCSTKCRVGYSRSNQKIADTIRSLKQGATPVIRQPAPPSWSGELEVFCAKHNISPQELMEVYVSSLKPQKTTRAKARKS